MFKNQGGRHYWFAENLIKKGYKVTIFCASTFHNSSDIIDTGNNKYIRDSVNGIPFVFVKTPCYIGNGFQRIKNMLFFYHNLFPVANDYAKIDGKPDVIIASSVHPLTLVAGIKIAKILHIPCICEVRDLWPESLIAYGILNKNNLLTPILYQGEKWIYKKADSVIMTWEGGEYYIREKGWNNQIDLRKIHYISNGVAIDTFDKNSIESQVLDDDINNINFKNIVYAGSIRKVNNIGMILDVAKIIQDKGIKDVRFLIYGSGNEIDALINRCKEEKIGNVLFKGRVEKRFIPYILKKAHINLLHNTSTSLDKYGQSQNKLFEYLAAGKVIVQTYKTQYSICERFNCGLCATTQNSEEIAKIIIRLCFDDEKCRLMGENAREAAYEFDFNKLTDKLINIIESV